MTETVRAASSPQISSNAVVASNFAAYALDANDVSVVSYSVVLASTWPVRVAAYHQFKEERCHIEFTSSAERPDNAAYFGQDRNYEDQFQQPEAH